MREQIQRMSPEQRAEFFAARGGARGALGDGGFEGRGGQRSRRLAVAAAGWRRRGHGGGAAQQPYTEHRGRRSYSGNAAPRRSMRCSRRSR